MAQTQQALLVFHAAPGARWLPALLWPGDCVGLSHRGHCVRDEAADCSASWGRGTAGLPGTQWLQAPGAALMSTRVPVPGRPCRQQVHGDARAGGEVTCAHCCAWRSWDQQGTGLQGKLGFHCKKSHWPHLGKSRAWHWANSFVLVLWRSGATLTGFFAGLVLGTEALALLRMGCAEMGLPESLCPCPDPSVGARTRSVMAWRWNSSRSCFCFILSSAS